jgi:hypothetical protein
MKEDEIGHKPKCIKKHPHGRSRCKWEGNIRMDFVEPGVRIGTGVIWLRFRLHKMW